MQERGLDNLADTPLSVRHPLDSLGNLTRDRPYHAVAEEAFADDDFGEPFRGILIGVLAGALLWVLLLTSVWAVLR